ncbi:DNA-binding transcriptional ArsR family regulator [Phenylobacterium koreense]|uniref:DNA-binding transcriptional ArsR family regulator n=2 Tax=Phenylobacterium koreense TaxID=266125 RepID=A0ABV2ELV1_9CAUL
MMATLAPPQQDASALEACARSAARLLKLLASEQRLLLLCRLLEGESSVGELAEYARLAPSAASQHLAKMRAEGLVRTRREAQTIFYSLDDDDAVQLLTTLSDIYRRNAAAC